VSKSSWKVCRLFGIDLEIHFTFLFLLALYAYLGLTARGIEGAIAGLVTITLVFVSVVLHELGHSITAQRYGVKVPRIVLLPIGGMAEMASIPKDPRKELMVTINGPLVNFVIAAVIFGVLVIHQGNPLDVAASTVGVMKFFFGVFDANMPYRPWTIDWESFAWGLLTWNILMGLFNLLPIFPMDGGRIFRALMATRLPYLKATFIAVTTAKVLAAFGIGYSLLVSHNIMLAILLTFIWVGGEAEYQHVRLMDRYSGKTIRDVTRPAPADKLDMIRHARPILQASYPLEAYAAYFDSRPGRIFPVYDNMELIGVVRTDDFARAGRA